MSGFDPVCSSDLYWPYPPSLPMTRFSSILGYNAEFEMRCKETRHSRDDWTERTGGTVKILNGGLDTISENIAILNGTRWIEQANRLRRTTAGEPSALLHTLEEPCVVRAKKF